MPKILITGAAGEIGTRLRKLLPPIYPDLVVSDIKKPADLGKKSSAELVEMLKEDNRWQRETARRLLGDRKITLPTPNELEKLTAVIAAPRRLTRLAMRSVIVLSERMIGDALRKFRRSEPGDCEIFSLLESDS